MAKPNRADVEYFMNSSLFIPTRTIYMGSEHIYEDSEAESGTDSKMSERAIKNLHILENLSQEPITILLNNPGGDEQHGMAIYDAIRECNSLVTIKVYGQAMSMGSIILQAADKRILTPNSKVMIHYGTPIVADPNMDALSHENWTDESKKFNRLMEQIYLEQIQRKIPKFKLSTLRKMLGHDTILSAKESVELGLADEIG